MRAAKSLAALIMRTQVESGQATFGWCSCASEWVTFIGCSIVGSGANSCKMSFRRSQVSRMTKIHSDHAFIVRAWLWFQKAIVQLEDTCWIARSTIAALHSGALSLQQRRSRVLLCSQSLCLPPFRDLLHLPPLWPLTCLLYFHKHLSQVACTRRRIMICAEIAQLGWFWLVLRRLSLAASIFS